MAGSIAPGTSSLFAAYNKKGTVPRAFRRWLRGSSHMRWGLSSIVAVTGVTLASQVALAQDAAAPAKGVPTSVMFGSIAPAEVGNSNNFCTIPAGTLSFSGSASAFQRKGKDAFVQFANLDYFARPLDYNFGGWAQLHFTDSADGTVTFDVPPWAQNVNNGNLFNAKGYTPSFTDYSQSFSGNVLTVNFNLVFPPQNGGGTCTLPIAATYHDLS